MALTKILISTSAHHKQVDPVSKSIGVTYCERELGYGEMEESRDNSVQ
jgi:hypothetical protein